MSQVTNYTTQIASAGLTMAALKTSIENLVLAAASCNDGTTAPSNPFAGMLWRDTSASPVIAVKQYSAAFGWVSILTYNNTTGVVATYGGRTIGGTTAGDLVTIDAAQTLTNKTLTSPVINTPTGDVATITGTQTLTNKRLTSPKINEDVALTVTATQLNNAGATTASAAELNAAADGIGVTIPRQKIVAIGDWNMDTTATKTVASGLSAAKIIGLRAIVRDDADTQKFPLNVPYDVDGFYTANTHAGYWSIAGANIALNRVGGAWFDSVDFSATSFNRGWIIVDYID